MVYYSGKFAPKEINPLAINYSIDNKAGLPHNS